MRARANVRTLVTLVTHDCEILSQLVISIPNREILVPTHRLATPYLASHNENSRFSILDLDSPITRNCVVILQVVSFSFILTRTPRKHSRLMCVSSKINVFTIHRVQPKRNCYVQSDADNAQGRE